jgi:hypothetical protein
VINKKNVLGKSPSDLCLKDAIHVAIVSVRAAVLIKPGDRCGLNSFNEAVPDPKGPGVADPFLKQSITTGQSFWMLLDQDSVPNVTHVWEHPTVTFAPPTREVKLNQTLVECAEILCVTYEQLMAACAIAANDGEAPYPGTLTKGNLMVAWEKIDRYDLWSEWAAESGFEFENTGSACCPEYDYPHELFAEA